MARGRRLTPKPSPHTLRLALPGKAPALSDALNAGSGRLLRMLGVGFGVAVTVGARSGWASSGRPARRAAICRCVGGSAGELGLLTLVGGVVAPIVTALSLVSRLSVS